MNDPLNQLDHLPALPGAVARVVAVLQSGEYSIDELDKVVRYDEALATAVLRAANSSLHGAPGRTFDLRGSMVRLGRANLMQIVLEQQMSGIFESAGASYGLRRHAMWRGAVGGAVVAEAIARDVGYVQRELCFLAALMRDIGKLAIDAWLGQTNDSVPVAGMRAGATFLEQERAAMGHDHAELGSALARKWQLPEQIQRAVLFHHNPPAQPPEHDDLFDIVHAADVVCLWAGLGVGYDGLQYRVAPHVRESILSSRAVADAYITLAWDQITSIEANSMPGSQRERCA